MSSSVQGVFGILARRHDAKGTVQRSFRMPVALFSQVQNIADESGVKVACVINLLIESGLDAVKVRLPLDVVDKIEN